MLSLSLGVGAVLLGAVSVAGGRGESRAARAALVVLVAVALAARLTGRVG